MNYTNPLGQRENYLISLTITLLNSSNIRGESQRTDYYIQQKETGVRLLLFTGDEQVPERLGLFMKTLQTYMSILVECGLTVMMDNSKYFLTILVDQSLNYNTFSNFLTDTECEFLSKEALYHGALGKYT